MLNKRHREERRHTPPSHRLPSRAESVAGIGRASSPPLLRKDAAHARLRYDRQRQNRVASGAGRWPAPAATRSRRRSYLRA